MVDDKYSSGCKAVKGITRSREWILHYVVFGAGRVSWLGEENRMIFKVEIKIHVE